MLGAIPYTGNKQSLLKDILPHFPKYNRFIDCFCGGLSVSLNVPGVVIANDIQTEIIDMYRWMQNTDFKDVIELKNKFSLDAENKTAYHSLRDLYNTKKRPEYLYLLAMHSFSNMIRFSGDNFNSPFGRRTFTKNCEKRWKHFNSKKDITFESKHYSKIDIQAGDFIYCDPPYLITDAAYNSHWSEDEERKLLHWLDEASASGLKFCLSNVVEHSGKKNEILSDWMKSYNVVYLQKNYVFNQHHSDKKKTVEVLIKNY